MMSDKDCIDFNNYLDDLKKGERVIKVNNYIRFQIHDKANGHDIIILTGDEKNIDSVVVQKFECRWPKNRNPRKKPFTNHEKKI